MNNTPSRYTISVGVVADCEETAQAVKNEIESNLSDVVGRQRLVETHGCPSEAELHGVAMHPIPNMPGPASCKTAVETLRGGGLTLDDNLNFVTDVGQPVAPGTKVYCSGRGYLGRFVRVGPECGDLGGPVAWFDDPKADDLADGKMRAVCPTNSHLTLDPASCKETVEAMGRLMRIEPAVGDRDEALRDLSRAAYDLIRVVELERSGIRDGDGYWHGSDALGGTADKLIEQWDRLNAARSMAGAERRRYELEQECPL